MAIWLLLFDIGDGEDGRWEMTDASHEWHESGTNCKEEDDGTAKKQKT